MPNFSRSALRSLCALPVALLIATGPALAQPQDETVVTATHRAEGTVTRSIKVSYAGLDLGNVQDRHRLAGRINAAANAVCADEPDQLWDKFAGMEYDRCHANAVATAAARIPGAVGLGRD